ncbi:MAG: NADH-quinone oxidoreductase subunit N [Verrucomicrobiaceae bacterium]|nr:NADH-quinone oxidoreductase subunit N [Verrucomicrobiaceae bacterium]
MSAHNIEIALAVAAVALLGLDAFVPTLKRDIIPKLSIGLVGLALLAMFFAKGDTPAYLASYYRIDSIAMFYKVFALVATLAALIIAREADPVIAHFTGTEGPSTRIAEFYILPLIVCVGLMWMASAQDLISVFVPLELVTVTFYVLVAFARRSAVSLEAGVKYLILGALSTGILVYGIAWIYGATGSMTFAGIAKAVGAASTSKSALIVGAALLLAGLGFKVAAAPFHVWVPDVYQGAPTPVTAFLSVGSKAGAFIVLTRAVQALTATGSQISGEVQTTLLWSGVITILFGSLAAITQTQIKRLLGYSSISHAGFILLALAAGDSARFGISSEGVVAFYLATYLPMTMLGFLLLAVLRSQGVAEELSQLQGLSKRSPGMAFALAVAFASLAGLPLTAGFIGKMLVFLAAVDKGWYGAVGLAVVGAAAGFYYYFRPILAAYSAGKPEDTALRWSLPAKATAAVLVLAIVTLGVYPKALQSALKQNIVLTSAGK